MEHGVSHQAARSQIETSIPARITFSREQKGIGPITLSLPYITRKYRGHLLEEASDFFGFSWPDCGQKFSSVCNINKTQIEPTCMQNEGTCRLFMAAFHCGRDVEGLGRWALANDQSVFSWEINQTQVRSGHVRNWWKNMSAQRYQKASFTFGWSPLGLTYLHTHTFWRKDG